MSTNAGSSLILIGVYIINRMGLGHLQCMQWSCNSYKQTAAIIIHSVVILSVVILSVVIHCITLYVTLNLMTTERMIMYDHSLYHSSF